MRKFSTLIFAATLTLTSVSCSSQKTVVNREVESTSDGKMLLGPQTKNQLLKSPYSEWYTPEFEGYSVDENAIAELRKEKLSSYNLTVVMGTWCEDSHRQVPRLMRILETLKFPENKLTMIGVNRKKEPAGGEEGLLNIQFVPTIIVQKYGKEIGRIVENPQSGYIERDLVEILKRDNSTIKEIFK